jgi:uncharacterized protein YggE
MNRLLNSPAFAGTVVALVVGLLLSVFLLTKIISEVVYWGYDDPYSSNTITVYGEGEIFATPDIATFSFNVSETAETTEAAQEIATEKINKATAFLKENGVEDKDIKTTTYNVYPQYDYNRTCTAFDCPPSTPEIVGYEVYQTTRVKVRQADEAGRFLTELGKIGISNVSGLSFTTDDEDVLYEQAREEAIKDAKAKAKKLAKQLGVGLDGIVSFGEEEAYPYYDYGYEGLGGGPGMAKAMSVETPELSRGENSYTSNVWVTYRID